MELNGLPSTVMLPLAVTLTFDLFTREPNQYVSRFAYMRDPIFVKLAEIVTKTLYLQGFLGHHLL